MSEWECRGRKFTEAIDFSLSADILASDLRNYQKVIKGFSVENLLELHKIRALAMIASAVGDHPEYFAHELVMSNIADSIADPIKDGLTSISDSILNQNIN